MLIAIKNVVKYTLKARKAETTIKIAPHISTTSSAAFRFIHCTFGDAVGKEQTQQYWEDEMSSSFTVIGYIPNQIAKGITATTPINIIIRNKKQDFNLEAWMVNTFWKLKEALVIWGCG